MELGEGGAPHEGSKKPLRPPRGPVPFPAEEREEDLLCLDLRRLLQRVIPHQALDSKITQSPQVPTCSYAAIIRRDACVATRN